MSTALDDRPLPVRLQARILKVHGGSFENQPHDSVLTTDSALHKQSIEAISELATALYALAQGLPSDEAIDAARAVLAKYREAPKRSQEV